MGYLQTDGEPQGRLVPVFAGEDGLACAALLYELAQKAASQGDTVLIIDCDEDRILRGLNICSKKTLADVLADRASLSDAKNIMPGGQMTICSAGSAPLTDLLGVLAAMSLSHDWVFVLPPSGCTPAHIRLAAAADSSILLFNGAGDRFMRAYWMLDAIRTRAPKCDPLLIAQGENSEAREAYDMLEATIRDYLGAPPPLVAMIKDDDIGIKACTTILNALKHAALAQKAA